MDVTHVFQSGAATMQRIFSEAVRVLYAYPIFLLAIGAISLYALI